MQYGQRRAESGEATEACIDRSGNLAEVKSFIEVEEINILLSRFI
jgi:hypothetical protein